MDSSESKKTRRRLSPSDKLEIIRRHLQGGEKLSDICDEVGIHPGQVYRWQKELFDNGSVAFERNGRKDNARIRKLEKEIDALRAKVAQKDEVIGEIMEEHVRLKKSVGES